MSERTMKSPEGREDCEEKYRKCVKECEKKREGALMTRTPQEECIDTIKYWLCLLGCYWAFDACMRQQVVTGILEAIDKLEK